MSKRTRAKELCKKTSEELGISEELMHDIVNFYYDKVKDGMESLENVTIFLHGLGTIRLSRNKLRFKIKGLKMLLESNKQEDFEKVVKYNLTQELLEKQEKALEIADKYYDEQIEKRKEIFKECRTDI